MDVIEIRNPQQYTAHYAALARALGSARVSPAENELALLTSMVQARAATFGSISNRDLYFVTALIRILQPRQLLEIGTASGASAAFLARAAAAGYAERGAALPETLLHTIDRKERCLFDDSKPIGFHLAEIVPELASRVQVHPGQDSSLAAALYRPGELDFAFVDGNHQHPWPLLDTLRIAPLMAPGSWMVLDDINLAEFYSGAEVRRGPRYLFEAWPGPKLPGWNVGAIRLPADRSEFALLASRLQEFPFEVSQSGWKRYRHELAAALVQLVPAAPDAGADPAGEPPVS